MTFPLWASVTLVAVALLTVADVAGSRAGFAVAKTVAAAGFVGAGLAVGALDTPYGRAILAGLLLSVAGDVLLVPRAPAAFTLGIGSFLLAHVAYAVAFVLRGVDPTVGMVALAVVSGISAAVFRWLHPHVPADMRIPVGAYFAVVTVMVAAAIATHAASPCLALLGGALGFWLSDLSVARDRFVAPGFVNRAWGHPLYFAAQLALAWSARVS